jgi:large subunit ribosomal protein L35
MPKMKTKRAACKRFKKTGTGKVKYKRAFGRHILTSKSAKRKRSIGKRALASAVDTPELKRMLLGG